MRRSVRVTIRPAAEPVTLGEARAYAKIDGTDDDPLIASLITAATEAAEQHLRRAIISQTLTLTLDPQPSGCYYNLPAGVYDLPVSALYGSLPTQIELPKGPVSSITSVTTYDEDGNATVMSASGYFLSGDRFALKSMSVWPVNLRSMGALEIAYVAGFGPAASDVPQPVKTAILMHVQRMYDERIVCEMPESCATLLRHYRVMDGLGA
ncbi:head-tail connector protein [Zavarzinella formosa]|uniref:head-tail connector protein n=1 Tax=Zavarzinella formosa TaxID=360055 RepID=UPI0002F65C65|nr:head-tail connector protein [Zavarzinella formosa]